MSDTPAEAPETDTPGEKVYICPACGTRYDEPTTCSNGHEPTATVEYCRATVEAAAAGDADAQQAIADASADAGVGDTAGIATQSSEAIPPGTLPAPVSAEVMPAAAEPAAEPEAPAASAAPAAQGSSVGHIFAQLEAAVSTAVSNAKSSLGL